MAEAKSLKIKKKKWCTILAPKLFREMPMGEILLEDVRKAVGRIVKVNLMELTNDMKKQNINMGFTVKRAEGDKLFTEVIGFEVVPTSIRRLVRRGHERIDSSVVCFTADNKRIRIKSLLLTRSLIKGSVKSSLVKNLKDYLISNVKKVSYDSLVSELVAYKIQRIIHSYLNKTYPLRTYMVKQMKIEKEKKERIKEEESKEAEPEEVKETKPEEKKAEKELKKEVKEEKKEKPKEEKKEDSTKEDKNAKTSN